MNVSRTLSGKRLLLGITGGIAAYKSAELTRLLVKAGVNVTVVMTHAAQRFITPVTLQALSGNTVFSDLWDASVPDNMAHIALSRDVDAILVAPASADFMAKLAHGFADDLLSTICLAREVMQCPLLIAPAMNRQMWDQSSTQRNVAQLRNDRVCLLGPAAGEQACGEVGLGRMLEPIEIFEAILTYFEGRSTPKPLNGVKALVTAGPTFEPIDAVRGITNMSSGKMGYAVAEALGVAGATVTLVSGPTALAIPPGVTRVDVTTASQMLDAVNGNLSGVSLFFAVAAVADYTPVNPSASKLKKSTAPFTLVLTPTIDILASVASRVNAPFCVGFAAESDNVVEYAVKKRQNKRIPMIVANHAGSAIGADENTVTIIDDAGHHDIARAPKRDIAAAIVAHAIRLMGTRASTNQPQPIPADFTHHAR